MSPKFQATYTCRCSHDHRAEGTSSNQQHNKSREIADARTSCLSKKVIYKIYPRPQPRRIKTRKSRAQQSMVVHSSPMKTPLKEKESRRKANDKKESLLLVNHRGNPPTEKRGKEEEEECICIVICELYADSTP